MKFAPKLCFGANFVGLSVDSFVALLIWRGFARSAIPRRASVYFVVTAIAVDTILYGSHFGGRLVYEYGVGTAVQPAATQGAPDQS